MNDKITITVKPFVECGGGGCQPGYVYVVNDREGHRVRIGGKWVDRDNALLLAEFIAAKTQSGIDDYLEFCARENIEPEWERFGLVSGGDAHS